jgi:glycosyltransferase involved in cell wall biosynthesis
MLPERRRRRADGGEARTMRLLILAEVDPARPSSGAERVLAGHVSGLLGRGHVVTVVTGARGRDTTDDRLQIVRVGWSARTPWRARRAATVRGADNPFDALLVHHPYPAWRMVGTGAFRQTPTASVFLSGWAEEYDVRRPGRRHLAHRLGRRFRLAVERRVLSSVGRVLAMSRFMAERAHALHGLGPDRIRIVPGGVDRERFRPAPDRPGARAAFGLPPAGAVVLTLRNLEPRMGLEPLVAAMPAIRAGHPDALLVVAGDGPLRRELEARVTALGLGRHVRFTGFVGEADLPALYAAADLFVLPTQALEGFGLVTLEALACGTPVVGTRVGATPELLEPLDPALVVDAPTPEAIAAGVARFLARGDREALSARCRAHTAAYDWSQIAEALERELLELAGLATEAVSP